MTRTNTAKEIARELSQPMRKIILAGNDDEVEAGTGTWLKLKELGLLDDDFMLTPLGHEVRNAL